MMKQIVLALSLIILASTVVAGTNGPPLPIKTFGISGVVGAATNEWLYVWPHDLVPETFINFTVVSTPIDRNSRNQGHTKSNWGRPIVLSNGTARVEIKCMRDYPMNTSCPWAEDAQPMLTFSPVDFHGLSAGETERNLQSKAMLYYFVFKHKDVVFDIRTRGDKVDECRAAALSAAEQIWQHRTKTREMPTTPYFRLAPEKG